VRSIGNLREGILLLTEGAGFLRRERRLWALAWIPILFALVSVVSATSIFWVRLDWIHAYWVELLPVLDVTSAWSWIWVGPGRLLFWLAGWLGVLVSLAISLLAALLLANLAAAPFLDRLSLRVEEIVSGQPSDVSGGFWDQVSDVMRSFAAELRRLAFLGFVWLVLSLVGVLIPGAQLVTAPLLVVTTILFLPLDYAGFALDRRGIPFARRRGWLVENLSLMMGFGAVAFVACLVPGLNLLIMPAQVTAGTLLVLRRTP
jgi:CysZ protein